MKWMRVALGGCFAWVALLSTVESQAGLLDRFLPVRPVSAAKAKQPEPTVAIDPVVTGALEEIPAPSGTVVSGPQPCIHYHHKGPKLCCGDCRPDVPTILQVKHPCVCCAVDVPVCIPACCTGEPTVCFSTGFLGRDVVEYEWCCGYSVRVTFRHVGDLVVSTWGR